MKQRLISDAAVGVGFPPDQETTNVFIFGRQTGVGALSNPLYDVTITSEDAHVNRDGSVVASTSPPSGQDLLASIVVNQSGDIAAAIDVNVDCPSGEPLCRDDFLEYIYQTVWPVSNQQQCPGFLPSRLTVGRRGRVTPGDANRLRSAPGLNSRQVGQIPGSGVFDVLNGPACEDGMAWWLVDYDGTIGWTAEGDNGDYWLEPTP